MKTEGLTIKAIADEDNGATVQIANGLKSGAQIIVSPHADLADNAPVEAAKPPRLHRRN